MSGAMISLLVRANSRLASSTRPSHIPQSVGRFFASRSGCVSALRTIAAATASNGGAPRAVSAAPHASSFAASPHPQLLFSSSSPISPSGLRYFSSSRVNMAGTKIDGTAIARSIREKLNAEIRERQESNPRFKPSLVIFQGECRLVSIDL